DVRAAQIAATASRNATPRVTVFEAIRGTSGAVGCLVDEGSERGRNGTRSAARMIQVECDYIGTISVLANASWFRLTHSEPARVSLAIFSLQESPETQRRKVVATPSAMGPRHLKWRACKCTGA